MAHTSHDTSSRLRDNVFWFCIIVTVIQMSVAVGEFLGIPGLHMPTDMPLMYAYVLIGYLTWKELDRWLTNTNTSRRGEVFFWMWAILTEALLMVQITTHRTGHLPHSVVESFAISTAVYVVSGSSRILHCRLWGYCRRYFKRNHRH